MPRETKPSDTEGLQPAKGALVSIDQSNPVWSILPHSCRLLGSRLAHELDAFRVSRHEGWRFGPWLQERIEAGLSPGGPVEDAIRLEMAIFDARTGARSRDDAAGRRLVLLRYDPDELLDPTILAEALQPVASGVVVQVDATGKQLLLHRIDDRFGGRLV